jgi:hypothetical protein
VAVDVLSVLISWCEEGLSVDKAMAQPETAYKVRHLKMGIRLAAALSSCDNALTRTVLVSINITRCDCLGFYCKIQYILTIECSLIRNELKIKI